jgi:hypothetical protein
LKLTLLTNPHLEGVYLRSNKIKGIEESKVMRYSNEILNELARDKRGKVEFEDRNESKGKLGFIDDDVEEEKFVRE